MTGLPKTQTEVCKACGIVHSPRHWADEATQHIPPAASPTEQKHAKPSPKKHALWQDKAGQFIAQFSRTKTEPVITEHHHSEAPERLQRRSSSLSRRDSGLAALDMRDGVIDFRDEGGNYTGEWDHVITKKS